MTPHFLGIFILLWILKQANGLYGPNVCTEQQNYTLTTRVKYQQPVQVKTYEWCYAIPPKCTRYKIEIREKWKVQTETRYKTLQSCCGGFKEQDDKCFPKCPEGLTGDKCDEDCPLDRWGKSCNEVCICPVNSNCDSINGKCICINGWAGPSCNVQRNSYTRVPWLQTISSQNKQTKILFDWSTPVRIPITIPKVNFTTNDDGRHDTTTPTALSTIPMTVNISEEEDESEVDEILSNTSTESVIPNNIYTVEITSSTLGPTESITEDTSFEESTTHSSTTILKSTTQSTTLDIFSSTMKSIIVVQNASTTETQFIDGSTVDLILPPATTPSSQIEKPEVTEVSLMTDSPITVILHNLPKSPTKESNLDANGTASSAISFAVSKSTASTARRKQPTTVKAKSESEILNITLITKIDQYNFTKIYKNAQPKGLYSGTDGGIVTIPVAVIMDKPTITRRRNNYTTVKQTNVKQNPSYYATSFPSYYNVTSPFLVTTDLITEETKHVLTEPEQITSVAGSDDSGDNKDDLYSTLSIAAGVAAALILMAGVIVMVTRCRKVGSDITKKDEMDQVQSMMNGLDDLPSTYLRSIFHSPLPDPPSSSNYSNISLDKNHPTTPFMQQVVIHAVPVSPQMMENFREILECHYDHPKPPRPTSFSPVSRNTFGTATSTFQNGNTLPKFAQSGKAEHSFPVTDAAITTLKMESRNNFAIELENTDPVYDEIPAWNPAVLNRTNNPAALNRTNNQGERISGEAVTEL